MKRHFNDLWLSNGGDDYYYDVRREEEKRREQICKDEEYARMLYESEEREERNRLAQEKADEELARKLSESFSDLPQYTKSVAAEESPSSFIDHIEFDNSKLREQINNDELLAISLAISEPVNNKQKYEDDDDDDDIQITKTKRPKIMEYSEKEEGFEDDDDKRTHLLIASVKDELRMPEIDIHSLLCEFNRLIFHGKLDSVSISWSSQMKLCAGVCKYSRGGFCEVRLSEPLLKFRPRDDFLNTLLHEMIHAYCNYFYYY